MLFLVVTEAIIEIIITKSVQISQGIALLKLTNYVLGILNSCPGTVNTGSQCTEAMIVGWTDLYQGNI